MANESEQRYPLVDGSKNDSTDFDDSEWGHDRTRIKTASTMLYKYIILEVLIIVIVFALLSCGAYLGLRYASLDARCAAHTSQWCMFVCCHAMGPKSLISLQLLQLRMPRSNIPSKVSTGRSSKRTSTDNQDRPRLTLPGRPLEWTVRTFGHKAMLPRY